MGNSFKYFLVKTVLPQVHEKKDSPSLRAWVLFLCPKNPLIVDFYDFMHHHAARSVAVALIKYAVLTDDYY
jgi:hypothetical protein